MIATVDRIIKEVDEATTGVLKVSFDDENFKCSLLAAFDEELFELGKETFIDLCLYPEEYRLCNDEYGYSEMIVPSYGYKDNMPYNTVKGRVLSVDELNDKQYIYITCFGKDLTLVCSKDTGEPVKRGDVIEAICWSEIVEGEPDISKDPFCMYLHQVEGLELREFRDYFINENRILKYYEIYDSEIKEEADYIRELLEKRKELIKELQKKASQQHNDRSDKEDLYMVLGCLTDREEALMRMRFGIDDGVKRDISEVSDKLGISLSSAEQIETDALRKLSSPEKKEVFDRYVK